MALTIEIFEVDVVVRPRRSATAGPAPGNGSSEGHGLIPGRRAGTAGGNVAPSSGNGGAHSAPGPGASAATTVDRVLGRAAPPTHSQPSGRPVAPIVASAPPRFIAPPIQSPAPKPLPRSGAPPPPSGGPMAFKPMFKRMSPPPRETSGAARVPAVGAGRPLDEAMRRHMEGFFGADLGDVRVHAGADAATLAKSLGAEALTIGRAIYFAQGKYDPLSRTGKALLGHELTHVVQQSQGRLPVQTSGAGRTVNRFEAEAEAVSRIFLAGRDSVEARGLVVERYRSTYRTNRPATEAEQARLEKIAMEALKTCSEIVRAKHPEALRDSRTLERLAVDVDISLGRGGDLEAGREWGRRLAEAIIAAVSGKADSGSASAAAPATTPMASPDDTTAAPAAPPTSTTIDVKNVTFDVTGKTLAEVAAQLNTRDEWGRTTWNVTYGYQATEGVATSVTVSATIWIELPRWLTVGTQPRRVQSEWERMTAALRRHEDNHVRIARE